MRVLLVNDTPPLVRAVRRGLEGNGFAVDVVPDGGEADARCRATFYDVIVLDVMLPGQDGLSLLKKWRADGVVTNVLVLTAGTTVRDRVLGLDAGADGYLTKPVDVEELLSRVKALVRRGRARNDSLIRVCDLTIDTTLRRVERGGRPIRLTQREYALLELLALHRGRVVTRTMIGEHLYHEHYESRSNVVDVYIRYLRGKIDRGFDPPLILTEWGKGYKLRGDDPSAGGNGQFDP